MEQKITTTVVQAVQDELQAMVEKEVRRLSGMVTKERNERIEETKELCDNVKADVRRSEESLAARMAALERTVDERIVTSEHETRQWAAGQVEETRGQVMEGLEQTKQVELP